MMTSLNLLTLEVYYRHLPLYYRDAGDSKDAAVQKATADTVNRFGEPGARKRPE